MAEQKQINPHQAMAANIHNIFQKGVQVSSAHAEVVVEMKLWLKAIAEGQIHVFTQLELEKIQPVTPPEEPEAPPLGEQN